MANKYYAVRKGRQTGIFKTWDEVKRQVTGFSNAEYKSFFSEEEAQAFMNADNKKKQRNTEITDEKSLQAYVDGSFSEGKGLYSCGVVLLNQGEVIEEWGEVGNEESLVSMRNVAGEISGAMMAIKWAYENMYEEIEIFYDYMGIEKWATGDWKANKIGTKEYVSFISEYKDKIHLVFNKVKAHTGVTYNERADQLAARAIERID